MKKLIITLFFLILTSSNAMAEESIDGSSGDRKFYIHKEVDELANFNWGNFLTCLRTVKFPDDQGPREVNLKISRLAITMINNQTWVLSIREDESSVILESITIDTKKYYTLKDKRRLFLRIVGNCQL
jgi:hypothetical protein